MDNYFSRNRQLQLFYTPIGSLYNLCFYSLLFKNNKRYINFIRCTKKKYYNQKREKYTQLFKYNYDFKFRVYRKTYYSFIKCVFSVSKTQYLKRCKISDQRKGICLKILFRFSTIFSTFLKNLTTIDYTTVLILLICNL